MMCKGQGKPSGDKNNGVTKNKHSAKNMLPAAEQKVLLQQQSYSS